MIIRTKAFPRAGLVGNPSDGYFGKTIAFAFTNFAAEVTLYETPELEILPNLRDHSVFPSIGALASDVAQFGYYGGIRLLKATIKRFHDHCRDRGIHLHDRNFTIRYGTDIPGQVGLAGSSAIITACLRALMEFYGVDIPKELQPSLILGVETGELSIPAGLQDRVAQVYQGLVYMDFNREFMEKAGHGHYEPIDPALLPPVYIAYRSELSEGTEVFHNDIRGRWQRREREVVEAMEFWANLAEQVRAALLCGDKEVIPALLDANFDKRRAIYQISQGNLDMVAAARAVGASAKFCGSGGAIVGTYKDDAMFYRLKSALEPKGIRVLKPDLAPPNP
jgi:glucuronokinase